MTVTRAVAPPRPDPGDGEHAPAGPELALDLVAWMVALKLLVHLPGLTSYGYFLDEIGYLVTGHYLRWGYITFPPLFPCLARAVDCLGPSLLAARAVALVLGTSIVVCTMGMARRLGGGRLAQALAGLAALIAPEFLACSALFTCTILDMALSAGCSYLLVTLLKTGRQRLWVWFGVLAGLTMMSRYTAALTMGAVVFGLLLTPQRAVLRQRWFWSGVAIALALVSPVIAWQVQNQFPTVAMARHHATLFGWDGPLHYLWIQAEAINQVLVPLCLAGLIFLFTEDRGRLAAAGWFVVILFLVFMGLHAPFYYGHAVYPILWAAGGVAIERDMNGWSLGRKAWARAVLLGCIALSGAVTAPLMIPLLSPSQYIAYTRLIGRTFPTLRNEPAVCPLPQFLSDQFGLRERVAEVARVYHGLSPAERERTTILVREGATWTTFEFFGPEFGLPQPITNEADVALWFEMVPKGDIFLAVTYEPDFLQKYFQFVEVHPPVAPPDPWANPTRRRPVYVCRGLKVPWEEFWAATRCFADGS